MVLIKCESVDKGLRSTEATVTILDYSGVPQFLPIDRGVLSEQENATYLPVSIIHVDDSKNAALVNLPVEADSGAHRIWVNRGIFAPISTNQEMIQ